MAIDWQQVSDWFLPAPLRPRGGSLEVQRERRRMVRFVALVVVVCVSAFVGGVAQLFRGVPAIAALGLVATVGCASSLLAVRRGWATWRLVGALIAILGAAAAVTGIAAGRDGLISVFWLSLAPLVALTLAGPRVARWTLVLTLVVVGTAIWIIYRVPYEPLIAMGDSPWAQIISLLTLMVTTFALIRTYDAQTDADIAELEHRNTQLNDARAEADAASRAKSEFLATMSHEIRTPMNGVLGMTSVMLGLDGLPDEVRVGLTTIAQSGGTLMTVINDILDFSKIESGLLTLECAPVDLRAELQSLRPLLEGVAAERHNALTIVVEDGVPGWIAADAVRLRQIALNLISNALKFTTDGQVEVRASLVSTGQLQLAVSDTGIGLTASALERLFTPFTQADASTTRRYGGTGLGLAIVRRLAQAMNGKVVASSDPGRGSCFVVTLPLQAVAGPRAVTLEVAPSPSRRLTVLLAEDNAINQRVARGLLEQLGHQVVLVADGQQALEQLALARFDVVLMDCHMPVMDGFDATRALRASEGARHQVIIALTAASLPEEQARCLACGMDAVLLKPVQRAELASVLTRLAPRQALAVVA